MYSKERRTKFMGKATTIAEMVNTLNFNPLPIDDIRDFYVDTTEARGTDAIACVEYILKTSKAINKKFLFAGHTGSGKSTELIKLSKKIEDEYLIVYFSLSQYVNFIDVSCADLVLSMLNSIVDCAEANGICIDEAYLRNIISYWKDESIITVTDEEKSQFDSELGLGGSFLEIISAKIKALFQQSNTIKTETITRVDKTLPQFMNLINALIKEIKANLEGKDLLIIVDDLDKLNETDAYNIFKDHATILTSIEANVIYTFPVFMHYNKDYRYISMNFDESVILSMIMINTQAGEPFKEGRSILQNIVEKRADTSLFEKNCIEFAIKKSGGSIRSMLKILRSAAVNAGLRCEKAKANGDTDIPQMVTQKDLDTAYVEFKSSMKRCITTQNHVELLKKIYKSKNTITVDDDDMVMDMFRTFVIIEYNCERWCDLNPAVLDYLVELNEIELDGNESTGED